MADVLQDQFNPAGPYGSSTVINAVNDWIAQTFTATASYYIGSVKVRLWRGSGDDAGDITVSIKATDGGGSPTGADLVTAATVDSTTLDETEATCSFVTFTFATPYQLTSGTKYAIVIRTSAASATEQIAAPTDGTGYAGGQRDFSTNGGSSWNGPFANDHPFQTYGSVLPIEAPVIKRLVYICDGAVYHGTALSSMAEFTDAASSIDGATRVSSFEAEQKAFIVNGSTMKVLDYVNAKITTANVGANPPDRGNLLTDGTSGATMIVDYIDALSGATTIYGYKTNTNTFGSGNTVTGTDDDGNAISFVLNAAEDSAPHWWTWTEYGGGTTNMPSKSTVSCFWRGRAVLVDGDNPTGFKMSRIGNVYDFDADTPLGTDALRPVRNSLGDLGKPGDVIRALIPFNDTYLIFACSNSIYLLVNDPASGGQIGEIKGVGGIIDSRAWTWDDKGNLYILTYYGLMRVPKGFGGFENLTEKDYPAFVDDIAFAPATDRIVLQYDIGAHGLQITKTNVSDNTNSNWFYDPRTGGLFKDTFQTDHAVYSAVYYHANAAADRLTLYGCSDGYLRYFDATAKNDDGSNAIDSYIDYGPIQLTDSPDRLGKIFSVDAEIGDGDTSSDDIACRLWVDRSADKIVKSLTDNTTPDVGGTFSSGRRRGGSIRREVKGVYAGIKLRNNSAGESWSFEKLLVGVRPAGRVK